MLKRVIDDLKNSTGASLRMTSLAALAGFAGFIALGFLCAAVFIGVMQHYGAIYACLAIAVIFAVIASIVASIYVGKQRQARERAAAAARAVARAAANAPRLDPALIATGIQIARTVGLKKLVPLLALAGVAFGYMANRSGPSADEVNDEEQDTSDVGED